MKPYLNYNIYYDLLCGSKNKTTQLKYNIYYRNYFIINDDVTLKLVPPKYSEMLNKDIDYEQLNFYSKYDIWNNLSENIKYITVNLKKNQIVYIPPYWWYTFSFDNPSCIEVIHFKTYMNQLAIMNHIVLNFIQKQNITYKLLNKIEKINT